MLFIYQKLVSIMTIYIQVLNSCFWIIFIDSTDILASDPFSPLVG